MILLLSIVTVLSADAGTAGLSNEDGTEKVFGCQSSIKKPIVLASDGSTAGAMITVVSTTGGGGGGGVGVLVFDFLQACKKINIVAAINTQAPNFSCFIIASQF